MDLTKIEWKKIRSCDICEKTGFVREINDNEGKVLMEVCFYGCMDLRNIPTPDNSVCDFCYENKGTEEIYTNEAKWNGYYCERCKTEVDSIEEESRQMEIESKKKWEEDRRKVYENETEMDEDAKRFFDDYFAEPENKETVEIFVDIPEMYSSHAKYLKDKYEFESRKSTLKKGSYLILND